MKNCLRTLKIFYLIKETLSKVDFSTQSSISQDSISTMVSNIEANIKAKLVPILNLVLRLLTNAPHHVHVSYGGERGVDSSNGPGDDSEVVVGKVISIQTPTTIPMKPVIISSTTTTTIRNLY